ncbi:Uncharacterised protein [Candidatus Gugararchaeum adminiculabundum]|nr:Uncharacterised protein [Candidatus Gugararchaeum adminiculabundum]
MYEDEQAGVNGEMRFITLELMKIAYEKNKPFAEVASEFIKNVYIFEKTIKGRHRQKAESRMPARNHQIKKKF